MSRSSRLLALVDATVILLFFVCKKFIIVSVYVDEYNVLVTAYFNILVIWWFACVRVCFTLLIFVYVSVECS